MNFWFGSFLFGGFLIPKADMYYPFEMFYYIMPYGYFLRSMSYNSLEGTTWEPCDNPWESQVCLSPSPSGNSSSVVTGKAVLAELHKIMAVVDDEDTVARDVLVLIAFGVFYKVLYIVGILYKSGQSSQIHEAATKP